MKTIRQVYKEKWEPRRIHATTKIGQLIQQNRNEYSSGDRTELVHRAVNPSSKVKGWRSTYDMTN